MTMGHKIGVVTSGGDAPGMNACVRAIVKSARQKDLVIVGIRYGALGLLRNRREDFIELKDEHVVRKINQSGTFLKTARSQQVYEYLSQLEFVRALNIKPKDLLGTEVGRKLLGDLAKDAIEKHKIDALIFIGGDTTCRATLAINQVFNNQLPMVVIPATIDNDVHSTKQTLGFESAVTAAVHSVDNIRASAESHSRIFIIEVMGRKHGFIAQAVGLACGAEEVLVPEMRWGKKEIEQLVERLLQARRNKRESAIIIIAEGVNLSGLDGFGQENNTPSTILKREIARRIPDWEVRVSILGHLQRGAPPTPYTRILASRLGIAAVDYITNLLIKATHSKPMLLGVTGRDAFKLYPIHGDMIKKSQNEIVGFHQLCVRLSY